MPRSSSSSPALTSEMFELAERLDHFKKPLESGLKVANMGEKTLRWEGGGDKPARRSSTTRRTKTPSCWPTGSSDRGKRADPAGTAAGRSA